MYPQDNLGKYAKKGNNWSKQDKFKDKIVGWKRMQSKAKISELNPMWKGDDVGIGALHEWVKVRLFKPKLCQKCKKERKLELACKEHEYSRNLKVWWYICRPCHTSIDGKVKSITKNYKKKPCLNCETIIKSPRRYCDICSRERRLEWWKKYNKERRTR